MEPAVGRSIGEGFRAANKSWAGIGFFIGVWLILLLIGFLGIVVTNPPAALFQPPAPTPQGAATPQITPAKEPAAPTQESATAPQETQAANLFNQLETAKESTPPLVPVVPGAREEQIRVAGEWFGHAWPMLLVIFVIAIAVNTWLTGGQLAYLVKRVSTHQAAVSEFWRTGTKVFWPILGGSLLSLLAGVVLVALIALIVAVFSAAAKVAPAWLLVIFGLILGVAALIGLVWLGVRLAFWFIAIVAERLGPIAGLKTSFRTTRGRWWKLFGLQMLLGAIALGVGLAFSLLDGIGTAIGGPAARILGALSTISGAVANLYIGFVAASAAIRFYEDAKPPSSTPSQA